MTYIKRQLVFDILCTVSIMKSYYYVESENLFSVICSFILILKIFTMARIVNNFTDILLSIRDNTKLYYFIELISLLSTILFVGHVNSLLFFNSQINIVKDFWMCILESSRS